jgi:uncharacterized phage protein (TIGR02220 family)
LWASAISDPDLRNLPLVDFGRWCRFGVFLKLHGSAGQITLRSPGIALQELFEVPTFEDAIKVLQKFPNCIVTSVTDSSVTYLVAWKNWQKYQGDYSNDRVAKHREKTRHRVTPKKRREEKPKAETEMREGTGVRNPPVPSHISVSALSSTLDDARALLQFLNHKAGRNFQPLPANLDLISNRLKQGATVPQCRAIIGLKARAWTGTDMEKFLRPATLFNATKFAQYLGELPATAFRPPDNEVPHA